ncbi:MAG: PEP-CTERM sorting domain-containing protein [archaeon]
MKKLFPILTMRTMTKNTLIIIFAMFFAIGFVSTIAKAGETKIIATFADPVQITPIIPLFTVNLSTDTITGGWADGKMGLYLQIPYSGNNYSDAFFTMTDVPYTGNIYGGATGGGTVKFFAYGQSTSETPLIQIDFDSGSVNPYGLGGMDEFFANGVVISGSEIGAVVLSDEYFSFSFANQKALSGNWNNGYTATSAFTSSAMVPEPAMIAILSLGGLSLIRRKNK